MTDREKLRAEAAELFPRWTNLAHYVVSGHEVADAMAWARDTDPPDENLLLVLDLLDAECISPSKRMLSVIERRVMALYRKATASRIRQPEWIA